MRTGQHRAARIAARLPHHFPAAELAGFFATHRELGAAAFAHQDTGP